MPLASLWLQHVEGHGRTLLASSSHSELHHYNGKSQDQQEEQVHQHKSAPSVSPCDIGESPYISQSDGTACGDQDKSQTG